MLKDTDIIVIQQKDKKDLFVQGGIDAVVLWIEEQVADTPTAIACDEDMKIIRSNAYQIARAISAIEDLKKDLTQEWKTQAKIVDSKGKEVREKLRELQARIRKPLTEYEEAEEARLAAEQLRQEIEAAEEDAHQLNTLFDMQAAEKARLAAEEAARLETERIAREEQIRKDAAAQAHAEAQQKIAAAKLAEERAKQEAEDAKIAASVAEENARIRAEAEAKAKREAEEAEKFALANHARHRAKIQREAAQAIENVLQSLYDIQATDGLDPASFDLIADAIIKAIHDHQVPCVSINY